MTAQVGVLNKKGIALATDSAVTIGMGHKEKAFNSANKLFELIKGRPVAIMIYNNAEFLEIPWELIITDYAQHNGAVKFKTLKEYCEHFILYLTQAEYLKDKRLCGSGIQRMTEYHIQIIVEALNAEIEQMDEGVVLTKEAVKELFLSMARDYHTYILEKKRIYGGYTQLYEEDGLAPYESYIEDVLNEFFSEGIDYDEDEKKELIEIIKAAILSNEMYQHYTGIVIAGYGENEMFPSLYQMEVEMLIDHHLKVRILDPVVIGGIADEEHQIASIRTFAQGDVAETYIQGIDPVIQQSIDKILNTNCSNLGSLFQDFIKCNAKTYDLSKEEVDALSLTTQQEELLTSFAGEFSHQIREYINIVAQKHYAKPFTDMVGTFDKKQLAQLAEMLINLTSFKREMSIDTNSVGGPVDVAVISKAEGFVWINRKYYFDVDINPLYLEREEEEVVW